MTGAGSLWLGPVHTEARAGYQRARTAGLSPLRALIIGNVASFKECWTFRRNIAKHVGSSVRTVQRALTQARSEGLIGVARAKKTDVPPNWQHGPVTCGWSHRWVLGWGKAGQAVADAVHAAKARWMVKVATAEKKTPASATEPARAVTYKKAEPTERQRRKWTAEELEAEVNRLEALGAPPWREKPPPS